MTSTVLIANYNNGELLNKAINSAWDADEIVVYDDGSTDNSGTNVHRQYQYSRKVKVILAPKSPYAPATSQCNAYATAFCQSSGDVIFLLDGDDQFLPGKIKLCMQMFQYTRLDFMQHLQHLPNRKPFRPNRPYPQHLHSFVRKTHSLGWWGGETSTFVMKREVFRAAIEGLVSIKYPYLWADARISLSLLDSRHHNARFYFSDGIMGKYHFDPNKPSKSKQYLRNADKNRLAYFRNEVNANFDVSPLQYTWRRLLDKELRQCLFNKAIHQAKELLGLHRSTTSDDL